MSDHLNSWDRQNDTDKSFAAFSIYRDLGPNRSLSQVVDQVRQDLRQLKYWSSKYEWVDRCADFDRYIDKLAQKENEDVWLERRKTQKSSEWDASEKLRALAADMIEQPLFAETTEEQEDGRILIIKKPARWSFRDVARVELIASTLGRRATGLDQGEDMLELEEGVALMVELFGIIKEEVKDAAVLERIEQRFSKLLGEHS